MIGHTFKILQQNGNIGQIWVKGTVMQISKTSEFFHLKWEEIYRKGEVIQANLGQLINFYSPWNHQKTNSFLMIPGK